jgi:hypothetical protein
MDGLTCSTKKVSFNSGDNLRMRKHLILTALALVGLMAGGSAYSPFGASSANDDALDDEFERRKQLYVQRMAKERHLLSRELLCTASKISEETARIASEAVLFNGSRTDKAGVERASADLVNTYTKTCGGSRDDLIPLFERYGGSGVYKLSGGAVLLSNR